MRHHKRFKQLNGMNPKRDIGYINGKARKGCAAELKSAKQLQGLLRDYTYHLIGLGNTFRDIARVHGKFNGSMWRTYQGVCGAKLKELADQLNSIDPYDVDAILKIEKAIESLSQTLIKDGAK